MRPGWPDPLHKRHGLCKLTQTLGVHGVGLAARHHGFSETRDRSWVRHHHPQTTALQMKTQVQTVTSRRLDTDLDLFLLHTLKSAG
jgi:hypothetical protein